MRERLTGGKNISRCSMMLSAVMAVGYNLFALIKTGQIPTVDEQKSILMLCGALIVFFSPVYLSIWLDKIFGKRE
ncbi:MAG: hypothetical protein JXB50_12190 [Spirochaetes bacterium]|nr:hypothetical protein [Spirochaetota bacterium]